MSNLVNPTPSLATLLPRNLLIDTSYLADVYRKHNLSMDYELLTSAFEHFTKFAFLNPKSRATSFEEMLRRYKVKINHKHITTSREYLYAMMFLYSEYVEDQIYFDVIGHPDDFTSFADAFAPMSNWVLTIHTYSVYKLEESNFRNMRIRTIDQYLQVK